MASRRTVGGQGYFVVGDAAAVLDPSSSHGVLKALMSGMMAAHLIGRIYAGAEEERARAAYQSWGSGWFDHDRGHCEPCIVISISIPKETCLNLQLTRDEEQKSTGSVFGHPIRRGVVDRYGHTLYAYCKIITRLL